MTYDSPANLNMSNGLGELISYINSVSNQWFSNLLIIAIFVIVLMGYYKARDDFAGAFAVAGYGTFVVSLLFWLGGFISGITLGLTIGISIIGTIVLLMDNSN